MSGFAFPPPPPPPPKSQEASRPLHGHIHHGESTAIHDGQASHRGRGGYHHGFSPRIPSGAYMNPNFQPLAQRQPGTGNEISRHPPTPHASSASRHQFSGGNAAPYPDRSAAGHKRKLDALRGPQSAMEVRTGPEVAPAVPRFGVPFLARDTIAKHARASSSIPGRSLFGIGSSQTEQHGSDSSSDGQDDDDDDNVDEEAMYIRLGTKLVFEYEGNVVSLTSEADLARWQQERRKRFPTTHRVTEKYAERRLMGEERKRLLDDAYALQRPGWAKRPTSSRQQLTTRSANEQHLGHSSMIAKTTSPSARSVTTDLLGVGQYDSDEEKEGDKAEPRQTDGGKVSAADDSDDGPPEESSSKLTTTLPPADDKRACKYYFSAGKCKEGDACEYRHDAQIGRPRDIPLRAVKKERPKVPRPRHPQKKGIYQMLMNQENEATDRLALQVIKHLGSVGFFKATT